MRALILLLILITSTNYSQWILRNNQLPEKLINSIDAIDKSNAVIGGPGVFVTNDSGLNWKQISTEHINDVAMINANVIYAVTDEKIIKTTNGGTTWDVIFNKPADCGMLNYIKVFQNSTIVMGDCAVNSSNSPAKIFKSTDSGTTWKSMNQNFLLGGTTSNIWRQLDFGSSDTGFFYYVSPLPDQKRLLVKTNDGGANWTNLNLNSDVLIYIVKAYSPSLCIAYGFEFSNPSIYKVYITTDGGANWQSNPVSITGYGNSISFIPNNPNKIFLASNSGLYYSDNGGKKWTQQIINIKNIPNNPNRVEDIVFVDDNAGWFATTLGEVFWTENKGNATVSVREKSIPSYFYLGQNYPNPFNPSTTISYNVPSSINSNPVHVVLKVYDLLGREVTTLVNELKQAGEYNIAFSTSNSSLSSGVYIYTLKAGNYFESKRMILTK